MDIFPLDNVWNPGPEIDPLFWPRTPEALSFFALESCEDRVFLTYSFKTLRDPVV